MSKSCHVTRKVIFSITLAFYNICLKILANVETILIKKFIGCLFLPILL